MDNAETTGTVDMFVETSETIFFIDLKGTE